MRNSTLFIFALLTLSACEPKKPQQRRSRGNTERQQRSGDTIDDSNDNGTYQHHMKNDGTMGYGLQVSEGLYLNSNTGQMEYGMGF